MTRSSLADDLVFDLENERRFISEEIYVLRARSERLQKDVDAIDWLLKGDDDDSSAQPETFSADDARDHEQRQQQQQQQEQQPKPTKPKRAGKRSNLTQRERDGIQRDRDAGVSVRTIAMKYGVARQTVYSVTQKADT